MGAAAVAASDSRADEPFPPTHPCAHAVEIFEDSPTNHLSLPALSVLAKRLRCTTTAPIHPKCLLLHPSVPGRRRPGRAARSCADASSARASLTATSSAVTRSKAEWVRSSGVRRREERLTLTLTLTLTPNPDPKTLRRGLPGKRAGAVCEEDVARGGGGDGSAHQGCNGRQRRRGHHLGGHRARPHGGRRAGPPGVGESPAGALRTTHITPFPTGLELRPPSPPRR